MKHFNVLLNLILVLVLNSCMSGESLDDYLPNKEAGESFLRSNYEKPGVFTTSSGLQYEIITEGEGDRLPVDADLVTIHYRATKLDGTEFASSLSGDPVDVYPGTLIEGWREGLKLMAVGDKYKFYLPYQLGFGINKTDDLDPFSVIIYEIELFHINKTEQEGIDFLAANKLKDEITETDSGLQYEVITEGTGGYANDDNFVRVHYHGTLLDGTVFDSTTERGSSVILGLKSLIEGFSEGVKLMKVGSKYKFYLPYEIAYEDRGQPGIPPYSMLTFEIELLEIIE